MKNRIAWCFGIFLMVICSMLWVQNLRLGKEAADLRIELAQKNAPVAVAIEKPSASPEIDPEELERLQKNNLELIRLRNKFSLLQNELAELRQERDDLLRANRVSIPQDQSLRTNEALNETNRILSPAEAIASLIEQLINLQRGSEEMTAGVIALAKRLNVPDGETRAVSLADLTPHEIQQVRSYNNFQSDIKNRLLAIRALELKLAAEKIGMALPSRNNVSSPK